MKVTRLILLVLMVLMTLGGSFTCSYSDDDDEVIIVNP